MTEPRDESRRKEIEEALDFDPQDPKLGIDDWSVFSSDQVSRRSMLRLFAASGMFWAMSATWPGRTPVLAQEPTRGGVLQAGWNVNEIRTLDPPFIDQVLQFQVASNVFNGLAHVDAGLVPQPDLASGWEVSSNGTRIDVFLREGVVFHNGDDFTADDVAFTYNRSLEVGSRQAVLEPIDAVEVLDDFTVRFTLREPSAAFFIKVLERGPGRALTIVNQRAIEEMGQEQYALTPVGTGAFRVAEHTLGERLVLERNPDYFSPEGEWIPEVEGQQLPFLDGVEITPIPEPATIASALLAGDVQFIGGDSAPESQFPRIEGNPNAELVAAPGPAFQALFFNQRDDRAEVIGKDSLPTDSQLVREAIGNAIDREALIESALFGRGIPAHGSVNPATAAFFDEELDTVSPQASNLEEARRKLAEAGFPDGFTIKLAAPTAARRRNEIIADQLARVGIEVELEIVDFPVLVDRFTSTGEFEMLQIGSGGDVDPDDALVDWFADDSPFNTYGFNSEVVTQLIQDQQVATDMDARVRLVRDANRGISGVLQGEVPEGPPAAFLFHGQDIFALRNNVRGFQQGKFGRHIPGLTDFHTVFLTE